jgi:hypothetical protein
MDQALAFVKRAGFAVERHRHDRWRVTNPHTGEDAYVATQPGDRRILRELASLRKIGAPTSDQELAEYYASQAPPPPPPKPKPAPPPVLAQRPAPTPAPPTAPDLEAPPVRKTALRGSSDINPRSSDPKVVAAIAHDLWAVIRDECGPAENNFELNGSPGVTWRGSCASVVNDLWPTADGNARLRFNAYLRDTGNMECLKRGNPSLWWLRDEWEDPESTSEVPRGAVEVRTRQRPEPRLTDGKDHPVETRLADPFQSAVISATPRAKSADKPAAPFGLDPVAAITALVDRAKWLETENVRLKGELKAKDEQLDMIRNAFGGRP